MPRTLIPMLLLCAMLTACKTAPTSSIEPLLAPVHALKATVDCGEDKPDEQLPFYPVGPAIRLSDLATESRDELVATAGQLYAFSKSQQLWGVHAVGVVGDESTLRQNTRNCLDGLRAQGLIN